MVGYFTLYTSRKTLHILMIMYFGQPEVSKKSEHFFIVDALLITWPQPPQNVDVVSP